MIVEVSWATYQFLIWRCVVPGMEERANFRDVGGEQACPAGSREQDRCALCFLNPKFS
jgi:hypothetical protein